MVGSCLGISGLDGAKKTLSFERDLGNSRVKELVKLVSVLGKLVETLIKE